MDPAFLKLGDLDWFKLVKKRDDSLVVSNDAKAALDLVEAKITRLTDIMTHMKDTSKVDTPGTIKDL